MARPVPVAGPGLPGAVGDVRLRALARRARRRGAEDRQADRPGAEGRHPAPDRHGGRDFDETGFRTAGKLAWVHSASSGKFVLVTVHAKRGKDEMTAAGVLPAFGGIAVHDAWRPYDSFDNVAGHALCGAHVLRELIAVTKTGTNLDRAWAQQAIDALLSLDEAAEAARAAGQAAIDPETRMKHEDWYRKAAATGIAADAGRKGKLQQKRHALATRMQAREGDYLRFARDLRVPFTNNEAERAIRMSSSGSRSLAACGP